MLFPFCILAIRDEDDAEFMKSLFLRCGEDMYRVCWAVLKNRTDTEDAVYEALLRLIDRIDRVRELDERALGGYAAVTAKNEALTLLRKKKRRREVLLRRDAEAEYIASRPEEQILYSMDMRMLTSCVKQLSETDRQLFEMKYMLKMSPAEMEKELGILPSTLRCRLSRMRARLIALLEKEEVKV